MTYKYLESLNAKFDQTGEHQTRVQEVPISILNCVIVITKNSNVSKTGRVRTKNIRKM